MAAVLAGVAAGLAWQPSALWPLLLVGVPALTLLARGSAPRRAFGLGYLFGVAMLTVTISWVHVLGWWVAALLIVFMALFFGVLGLGLSRVTRLRWWPVPAAACWVAVELAYSSFPFGGFGWTRLAYAAVDTPLNGWLPVVGVAGVSFLVALAGQVVAWVVLLVRERRPRVVPRVLPAVLVLAALVAAGVGLRSFQVEPLAGREGSVTVGVVQGNVPGRGIEALGRARTVTNNHLSESVDLMARSRLGQTAYPGLPALAGELDRHRPAARRHHPDDRGQRSRRGGRADPRRRRHRGAGARRAADDRRVVGPDPRAARDLPQAQPGALRGVDPVP